MNFTLQRHAVRVTSFDEERREHATLTLWRSRPVEERLAAVEFLRKQFHGSGPRLQRVYRLVECPWR
jgi:hypothetical protein